MSKRKEKVATVKVSLTNFGKAAYRFQQATKRADRATGRAFQGLSLPWPDDLRDSAVRGHEMFIEDTIKRLDAIRALSPARVAEGEPVREALSNLVSLLLQTMEPIGPMRTRKDYPPELQTAINVLRSSPEPSPESPAKEQPGEQRWIPVSERLPEDGVEVDIWMHIYASPRSFGMGDDFRVVEAWRRGAGWFHRHEGKETALYTDYVTHWMPLPPPPERP